MWIKYRDILYNTDVMKEIKKCRTTLKAVYPDGTEIIIGRFKTMEETRAYYTTITQKLLAKDGMMIKDTKPSFSKKV